MSFNSTIQKTVNEIKKIESVSFNYSENLYDKIPTKYVLSLYRRCQQHISSYAWYIDDYNKAELICNLNYLRNAKDRLKKILDKRENLK